MCLGILLIYIFFQSPDCVRAVMVDSLLQVTPEAVVCGVRPAGYGSHGLSVLCEISRSPGKYCVRHSKVRFEQCIYQPLSSSLKPD